MSEITDVVSTIDLIEKFAKIGAILVAGAWVYFKTIRGRTFIPRLQPQISGNLLSDNGHLYLSIKAKVENVGSSMARIKEEGTGLKIDALKALGGDNILDLYVESMTVFPAFDIAEEKSIKIEPATTFYFEELIEVPNDKYDAFRIELHVSAPRLFLSRKDRRWRAFAMVLGNPTNNSKK